MERRMSGTQWLGQRACSCGSNFRFQDVGLNLELRERGIVKTSPGGACPFLEGSLWLCPEIGASSQEVFPTKEWGVTGSVFPSPWMKAAVPLFGAWSKIQRRGSRGTGMISTISRHYGQLPCQGTTSIPGRIPTGKTEVFVSLSLSPSRTHTHKCLSHAHFFSRRMCLLI